MQKKIAFSLSEVLVCLSVVAIMYALLTPLVAKFSPKERKVLLRKSYSTIETIVNKIINDDVVYPDISLGFADTDTAPAPSGYNKFCYYFLDAMNTIDEDFSNCTAKSSDGVSWKITDVKFKNVDGTVYNDYSTKISVDINGDKAPNCVYSAGCGDPDQFSVLVKYDGKIKLEDSYIKKLLENPMNNK